MFKRVLGWFLAIVIVLGIFGFAFLLGDIAALMRMSVEDAGENRVQNVIESFSSGNRIIVMPNSDTDELEHVLDRIYDEPALFWVDMTYNAFSFGDVSIIAVREKYDNIELIQKEIDVMSDGIIDSIIEDDMSEYDKVLAIHDWICENVDYGSCTNNSDQDIYGALVLRKALCAGYAESFTYLLSKVGIKSSVISGESINKEGESIAHAWNLVYIDNKPYYFDITWDDDKNGIIYDWFGITSEEFKKSHFPSVGYDWVEATSLEANYYYKNSMYIDSYHSSFIIQQINKQGKNFVIKCSDWLVMNKLLNALGDRKEIQTIMKETGIQHINKIIYIENERVCCVHVEIQ